MAIDNEKVKIRVRSNGLGLHRSIGRLIKGAIHYLPRNEVGTQLFDILDIEYKGVLRSSSEILALYNKATTKKEKRILGNIIFTRGIKKKGVTQNGTSNAC